MPILQNEEEQIAQFKTEMEKEGMLYAKHYLLGDTGEVWQFNFLRNVTSQQYEKAYYLLDSMLNK